MHITEFIKVFRLRLLNPDVTITVLHLCNKLNPCDPSLSRQYFEISYLGSWLKPLIKCLKTGLSLGMMPKATK